MADPARKIDDGPIDPAEGPMPDAAFEIIQRAHEICGHPSAIDLAAELEQRAEQALSEARTILQDLDAETETATTIFPSENSDMDNEYDGSTFAAACRKADAKQRRATVDPANERARRLLDDSVSLERVWAEVNIPRRAVRQRPNEAPPQQKPWAAGDVEFGQVIENVRPILTHELRTTKARIRLLWATAKQARNLGASNVIHDAFMALAVETNLIDKRGRWTGADVREDVRRHGAEDVAHVINWALRGRNPFETGPLK
jgi:hypothetical protein